MLFIRKTANIFAFFKTTLPVNLAISLCGFLFGNFSFVFVLFLTLGFAVSLAIVEVRNKNHYFFYFNNGLTKLQLWIFAYLMSAIFAISASVIIVLIQHLF